MRRRKFLYLVGGGIVLAAGAGAASGVSVFGVPPSATAAWRDAGTDADLRRFALAHALLAPNPHNKQPWIADLRVPGEIALALDTGRLLPETDPYGRQILLGAGGFLELLAMAAAERGHRAEIALFPEGEPGERLDGKPFARVRLVADATVRRDPLFAQILSRRTDRRAYDPARAIAPGDSSGLAAAIGTLPVRFGLAGRAGAPPAETAKIAAIRAVAREAWRIELTTEATMMESLRVLRVGSAEIDRFRDGIAITSPMVVLLAKTGLFDRSAFPDPNSQATAGQIDSFDAITAATPAYFWLVTEGNRRVQQIESGRAYARVNLAGAALGLAMHPNQQALQEFPEVAAPYRAIHDLLDAPTPRFTVQMLARLGYLPAGSAAQAPAPRRGLAAHLTG